MRKRDKNLLDLMLCSMLILSVIDFFHFANHIFAQKSYIANITFIAQKALYNYEIQLSENPIPLVESKSCNVNSSMFQFEALIPSGVVCNFFHFVPTRFFVDNNFSQEKSIFFYNSRGPPIYV